MSPLRPALATETILFEMLKKWWAFDAASYKAPADIPSPDKPRKLVLYKSDSCGYCMRVMRVLDQTNVQVELRDTRSSAEARQELYDATSRTTVPCLFVDDVPMFESKNISHWLLAYSERSGT